MRYKLTYLTESSSCGIEVVFCRFALIDGCLTSVAAAKSTHMTVLIWLGCILRSRITRLKVHAHVWKARYVSSHCPSERAPVHVNFESPFCPPDKTLLASLKVLPLLGREVCSCSRRKSQPWQLKQQGVPSSIIKQVTFRPSLLYMLWTVEKMTASVSASGNLESAWFCRIFLLEDRPYLRKISLIGNVRFQVRASQTHEINGNIPIGPTWPSNTFSLGDLELTPLSQKYVLQVHEICKRAQEIK